MVNDRKYPINVDNKIPLHIVILAAGQGTRMRSAMPKVLHPIGGKPMLQRTVDTVLELQPEGLHVIVGYEAERIKKRFVDYAINWVTQSSQLGTGHALQQALPHIPEEAAVLVLSADVPLLSLDTLRALLQSGDNLIERDCLRLLVATVPDPTGLGRIIRNKDNHVVAIIEEKDADNTVSKINEIYTGICCAQKNDLKRWLPALASNNAQNEYYVTDIVGLAVQDGVPVIPCTAADVTDTLGVNNRLQLQQLERIWQSRVAERLMLSGVTIADAARIDVRGNLQCDQDVFIDVNNVFEGHVSIGKDSHIGPNCILKNVTLGVGCIVYPNSVLEGCVIGDYCQVGPFSRVRPGTKLASECKVGNFVEMKNTTMGERSKANHLSYVGDAMVGQDVNIGAGMITCNYDGVNKHQSVIGDGAFIGSDTQLVAPVTIGAYATIGAGSTIRRDAPAHQLTLTESKQVTNPDWQRPLKKDGV